MKTQLPKSRSRSRGEDRAWPRNSAGAGNELEGAMASLDLCAADAAADIQDPSGGDGQYQAIASSCGDDKGRVPATARPLRLQCADCEELLHELANVITGVLMQSQMVAWKLPPYSHLKRSVREIERNAQRGSELMKRIMRRLGDGEEKPSGKAAAMKPAAREAINGEGARPHKTL